MNSVKSFIKDQLLVKIYPNRREMGREAAHAVAQKIAELISKKGEVNIAFAAAPSQNEFLDELIKCKNVEWDKVTGFQLDEYLGLRYDAPEKFANFLNERLFNRVNFKQKYYIDQQGMEPEDLIKRYSNLLKENPLDIVCMGIGENGHIAFNDPPVADFSDNKIVKLVRLDEECRQQQVNDGCFKTLEEVPTRAITMTIPTLLSATYIYCIVPGKKKSKAVARAITGEIDTSCPASILRSHQRAILYLDRDSAGLLF